MTVSPPSWHEFPIVDHFDVVSVDNVIQVFDVQVSHRSIKSKAKQTVIAADKIRARIACRLRVLDQNSDIPCEPEITCRDDLRIRLGNCFAICHRAIY